MNKKISFVALILLTLACVLPNTSAPVDVPQPPADINALQTIIVQTADAAQTQTAAVLPTATNTVTPTRLPSITPSPTVTFIFLLPTLTPIPTQTPLGFIGSIGGASGTQDSSKFKTPVPWSCIVKSVEPPFGATLQKKQEFYAYWSILNTGTKTWTRTTIDFVYTGGYRHDGTRIMDATESAGPGAIFRVGAKFTAPKNPGTYRSFFVLKVGSLVFCSMKVEFVIKD